MASAQVSQHSAKSLLRRGAIRRPYRLAFRPPTPLSDEDDNGAQADHLIGHGDAVWTAISDDIPP